jgi:hypothetical protein
LKHLLNTTQFAQLRIGPIGCADTHEHLAMRWLPAKVGAEYYTLISQLETGRGRVASDQYLVWSEALDVPHEEFVRAMLRFYDPVTYDILFGKPHN